ncbi:UvrD-helicase domain-containing protein [Bosea sp. UNC402CLCol]|uniref:UvrD-helicase domain-containing protein n=1 Tax=Bosea sp. UNC402CLCol TaxID=1510531 RepID=UPI000A872BAB|nr:UvrD-helicase domain-containing protein [Bosea sp. UNC402CLCol]
MKYISVELGAIDEIVGNRFLQSIEFSEGSTLAKIIKGKTELEFKVQKIELTVLSEGIFLTAQKVSSDSRYLVIDTQQSAIFDEFSEGDALFVFQKMLRFAKKIWQGLALNFSERILSNSSKALVFPFRGFRQAPYRVTLERDPNGERLAKRGDRGHFLLAYKAGHEGADANREVAELTNFRKAYESVSDVRSSLPSRLASSVSQEVPSQLKVIELPDAASFSAGSMYRRFDDWMPMLTTQQRNFVEAPIVGPYRIEGAAGTGKTLSLILKAVSALRTARASESDLKAVFVTHSDATKRSIAEVFTVVDFHGFSLEENSLAPQSIKICTLSELCAEQLRQAISESEFIDRDAMESKGLQLLYINEAFDEAMLADFSAHERFLTPEFAEFLKNEHSWKIIEMLQHEISVIIKGRASENLDAYKKVPSLKYGLPATSDADKGFVYAIFRLYQNRLGQVGQFDTDDVVLTTIGQLDTPIWRRRRSREGYDAIFIDETHLFNINELHLFHHFSKSQGPYPIIYSVDRSQAVGDRGWTTSDIANSLSDSENADSETKVRTIFRSSADIINLAFSIVSSGAMLFTNFDKPIDNISSAFTDIDEKLTSPPKYLTVPNEDALIDNAFVRAEQMQRDMDCKRSDILIVATDENILDRLEKWAIERNKPHLFLKKRGDALAVEGARMSSQFILGHADYVGGLEFFGVILVGVDGGRVPPTDDGTDSSRNYLSYAAHNRLYVAVTRARYRIEMLGEKARGPSKIIEPAIAAGVMLTDDLR